MGRLDVFCPLTQRTDLGAAQVGVGGSMGTPTSTSAPEGVGMRWGRGERTKVRGHLPPSYSSPLGWQTAAHTSATNSWGKANSPSTESSPWASWATLGLPLAASTIVEAVGEKREVRASVRGWDRSKGRGRGWVRRRSWVRAGTGEGAGARAALG